MPPYSKKQIDLTVLQEIQEEKPMQKEVKFRCRHCNRPMASMIDAYTCECKTQKKNPFWPASMRARRAPRKR